MPIHLSKKEKSKIKKQLELYMGQAETAIMKMISTTDGSADPRRILKLKQALLSLKVEYNRIKMKYEDETN